MAPDNAINIALYEREINVSQTCYYENNYSNNLFKRSFPQVVIAKYVGPLPSMQMAA